MRTIISAKTDLFAIFGKPISHAMSPVIHNAAFERSCKDAVMIALESDEKSFDELFAQFKKALNFKGFVFTMPVKTAAIKHMEKLSPEAEIIGATNCAVREADGSLTAYNTDSIGFWTAISEHLHPGSRIESAFVMGAGGMARAAIAQLALREVRSITAANRPEDTAFINDYKAFEARLKARCPKTELKLIPWDPDIWRPYISDAQLIANCSANGMNGKGDLGETFPFDAAKADTLFFEAIYEPYITPFIARAEELGHPVVHGIELLTHQGANAFKKWTGVMPDPHQMEEDIKSFLAIKKG